MGIGCGLSPIGKKWVEVVQLSWLARGDPKNAFPDVVPPSPKSGERHRAGTTVAALCGPQDKLACTLSVLRLWYTVGLSLEWDSGSRNRFSGDGGRRAQWLKQYQSSTLFLMRVAKCAGSRIDRVP